MQEWRARQFFPKDEEKTRPRCVNQLTIGILGYGNMGKSIAKLFKVSLILYLIHHMLTTNFDSWIYHFFHPLLFLWGWNFSIEIKSNRTKPKNANLHLFKDNLIFVKNCRIRRFKIGCWQYIKIILMNLEPFVKNESRNFHEFFSAIRLFFWRKNTNELLTSKI